MGVLGVGIDVVALGSFAEQLDASGSVFAEQTFTAAEIRSASSAPGPRAQHLAGRFAAKEAFVKAFSGARPWRAPVLAHVDWRDVETVSDGWGRPALVLHGQVLEAVTTSLGGIRTHLSITHEPEMAAAVVILEEVNA